MSGMSVMPMEKKHVRTTLCKLNIQKAYNAIKILK